MHKLTAMISALMLALLLAGCGDSPAPGNDDAMAPSSVATPDSDPYAAPENAPSNYGDDPQPAETSGVALGIVYPAAYDASFFPGYGAGKEITIDSSRIPDVLKGLPESMSWVFEFDGYYIEQFWVRSPDYAIIIRLSLASGSANDYEDLQAYYAKDAIEVTALDEVDGVEFTYDWGYIKLENQGHTLYSEITGDYGASWELPNNGQPLAVPPPFETHEGDQAYFYQKEDDFALWILDMNYSILAEDYGNNIQYNLLFNGKNENGYDYGIQSKWVFESDEMAMKFITDQGIAASYMIVGNVVYGTSTTGFGDFQETLAVAENQIAQNGGEMYLSKP